MLQIIEVFLNVKFKIFLSFVHINLFDLQMI